MTDAPERTTTDDDLPEVPTAPAAGTYAVGTSRSTAATMARVARSTLVGRTTRGKSVVIEVRT